jgi:hypothetical protein
MAFTFFQSAGKFCNDDTKKCTPSYSGFMGETDQTKKDRGPAPEGKYTVENSCSGKGERCNLKPSSSNEMFGRTHIQIHGDNGKGDQSASHGCIILNKADRANIKRGDTITVKK